ncbi:MAG: hypothetical protein ABF251_13270 [Nonlabens sp.]|uniref:hypothetical protein n=1 Tax=Nonlabens sp. TaxID=1888209 RepID=UPI00321AF580
MNKLFVILIIWLFGWSLQAQNDFYKSFIEANKSYASNIEMSIIGLDSVTSVVKGKTIISDDVVYTKLKDTEFFSFDKYQIKVVNPERTVLYSKVENPNTNTSPTIDFETLQFFYFLKKPKETSSGYSFELDPIENMSQYLNKMFVKTDKEKRVTEVIVFFDKWNSYGLSKIIYKISNRAEIKESQIKVSNFFKINTDGSIELLSKYKTYQLIQPNDEK